MPHALSERMGGWLARASRVSVRARPFVYLIVLALLAVAALGAVRERPISRAELVLFLVLLAALWGLPRLQVAGLRDLDPGERFNRENEARKTLAQILGGGLLLAGFYVSAQTLRLNQEGQITERFGRAVDQLGRAELEVRLGGIHALGRIAGDSEKDYWTVVEILAAYVRARSPGNGMWEREGETDDRTGISVKAEKLRIDVEAALAVIGRRSERITPDRIVDLGATDLRRALLIRANLTQTSFVNADLRKAQLGEANLSGSYLVAANLEDADLEGANLESANLNAANFRGANLKRAKLRHASLWDVILEGADLRGADLTGVHNLTGEQLQAALTDQDTILP